MLHEEEFGEFRLHCLHESVVDDYHAHVFLETGRTVADEIVLEQKEKAVTEFKVIDCLVEKVVAVAVEKGSHLY